MNKKLSTLFVFSVLMGGFTPLISQGSALVKIDRANKKFIVTATINYFGPAATEEAAKKATDEINLYWNGGSHRESTVIPYAVTVGNELYSFELMVDYKVTSAIEAHFMKSWVASADQNFIKLDYGSTARGDRSYMSGLCSSTGVFYLSDDLGNSTTAAHEFGHGLCLDHPVHTNWRGQGQPPIMLPRGGWVDAIYQWNPAAAPGQPGGTVNPATRRVIQFDVDGLNLGALHYDSNGVAELKPGLFSIQKVIQ